MAEVRTDSRESQNQSNPIDSVVSSQPELGPTPPDGGYGWMILFSALVYQITVPTIVVFYGILLLHLNYQDDYEDDSSFRLWDSSIGLVPVLFIVIKLLLEPWGRSLVILFNMPRIMAITGVCLVGAGVMLSSFTVENDENGVIINIFSGIFAGMGAALTGQQNEILLRHYFRNKLDLIKSIYRLGPSIGYSLLPFFIAPLCIKLGAASATLIYGAVIIQNCLFLAAYSRPIYITQPLKQNYKMLNDLEEDEDEEIFSNSNQTASNGIQTDVTLEQGSVANNEVAEDIDERVIATFNTRNTTREIVQENDSIQLRGKRQHNDTHNDNRFSSEFVTTNRFSSDFSSMNGSQSNPVQFQSNLDHIESFEDGPQSLYRETTLANEMYNDTIFALDNPSLRVGTVRRNKHYKRNFISLMQMLLSLDFYLHTILQTNIIFSLFTFGLLFAPYVSQQEPNMSVFKVATLVGVNYIGVLCLNAMSIWIPRTIAKRSALCSLFCSMAAAGFYGISVSENRSWLVVWGMMASYATSAQHILYEPAYEEAMSEFDSLATAIVSNFFTANFMLTIVFIYSYEYATCFEIAALVQLITASVFFSTVISKNYIRRY